MNSPWTYWIVDVPRTKNLVKGPSCQVVYPTLDRAERLAKRLHIEAPIRRYDHDTERLSSRHGQARTQDAKEA